MTDHLQILKEPPHSDESELAVLCSVCLRSDALGQIVDFLGEEDFYRTAHRHVYAAMLSIRQKKQIVDLVTLPEELKTLGTLEAVGGLEFVSGLLNASSTSANVVSYARRVFEKSSLRRLVNAAHEVLTDAYAASKDPKEIFDDAAGAFNEEYGRFLSSTDPAKTTTLRQAAIDAVEEAAQKALQGETALSAITTGLCDFDRITGGFAPGSLTVIAARPGMGKSALALSIALGAAQRAVGTFYLTLEMPKRQMGQRAAAGASGYSVQTAFGTVRELDEYDRIMDCVERLPDCIHLDDATPEYSNVRAATIRAQKENNIGLVIIDYLQLLDPPDGPKNREQEIAVMVRGLKNMAMELGLPIIVLAQLNRDLEKRADKHPQESDLRESGEIENAADKIIFIYRDEKYNPDTPKKGVAEIIVAKNRNGEIGMIELWWIGETMSFKSLTKREYDA